MVEDVVSVFNSLSKKFKSKPSLAVLDKIIKMCCNSSQVHVALDITDHMCQSGLEVPIESFHTIIQACEQNYEFDVVYAIYSVIRRHNLKPTGETFKSITSLCVKMKDFEAAYNMLTDAEEIGDISTIGMYNAILVGYFKEKNNYRALMVLKQMKTAGVKPDSETFSYLISNCESEKDIAKYLNELREAGVQVTKYVYMSLINAYAKLGKFDKAKQVLLEHEGPPKHLNEVKSVLISALASNGQISDALKLYEELKQTGCTLESKALISLIENIRTEGELDRLYQLLEDLNDSSSWVDGCSRVIMYCIQYNHSDSAINLLKQLKDKDENTTYMVVDQMFSQLWTMDPINIHFGMDLLCAIREDLQINISRTSLDFLLSSCVKAKDSRFAQLIWKEYVSSGLPYNVLTSLRMYQALLASGEHEAAKKMLQRIPKEDAHVRYVIDACNATYSPPVFSCK